MKPTISSRLLRKFQPKPTPEVQSAVRFLRSPACTQEPAGLADVVNQLTELVELLQDLPELEPLLDRMEAATDEYDPDYPPHSAVTVSFFSYLHYFGAPYGNQCETWGTVFLELGRAFSIHPRILEMLQALNRSRMGWYLHEGFSGEQVLLRDVNGGGLYPVDIQVDYRGEVGEIWLGCPVEWQGWRWNTTPYVIRNGVSSALPKPKQWTDWLDWIQDGYADHTSEVIFLELPETTAEAPEGCVSLAQRWSPAVIQESEDDDPVRPHLLLLVDEQGGRVHGFDQHQGRYTAEQALAWLRQQQPVIQELWVDDPDLHSYLQTHWTGAACQLRKWLPQLDKALHSMSLGLGASDPCLVELVGARLAQRFYESAESFFEREPWNHLSKEDILILEDEEAHTWGVVVMGSGGDQFGLAFYASPDEAGHAIQGAPIVPTLSFALGDEWLVAARDLDLLDAHALEFPRGQYPWLCYKPPSHQPPKVHHIHLVHWLLKILPDFIENGCPEGVFDGRYLALSKPQAGNVDDMLMALFLTAWPKKSQHAEMLAKVMVEFLRDQPPCPDFPEMVNRLMNLGVEYLTLHSRKRSLVTEFFREPGRDPLRKKLVGYVERAC